MPSSDTAKTASAHRIWYAALIVAAVIAGLLLYTQPARPYTTINEHTFQLEFASAAESRQKGLSGRTHLPDYQAMVFVYDTEQELCFWMKHMLVPIDMIWLDATKQVVHIEHAVPPESYPKQFCAHGRYVVEISAGMAGKASIKTGQTVSF